MASTVGSSHGRSSKRPHEGGPRLWVGWARANRACVPDRLSPLRTVPSVAGAKALKEPSSLTRGANGSVCGSGRPTKRPAIARSGGCGSETLQRETRLQRAQGALERRDVSGGPPQTCRPRPARQMPQTDFVMKPVKRVRDGRKDWSGRASLRKRGRICSSGGPDGASPRV
jgi:hypothetical protein